MRPRDRYPVHGRNRRALPSPFITGRPPIPWVVPAALLAAAALAIGLARMLWVGVDLSYTSARLVHLARVHPRFAEAVGYGPIDVRDLSVSRLARRVGVPVAG